MLLKRRSRSPVLLCESPQSRIGIFHCLLQGNGAALLNDLVFTWLIPHALTNNPTTFVHIIVGVGEVHRISVSKDNATAPPFAAADITPMAAIHCAILVCHCRDLHWRGCDYRCPHITHMLVDRSRNVTADRNR